MRYLSPEELDYINDKLPGELAEWRHDPKLIQAREFLRGMAKTVADAYIARIEA